MKSITASETHRYRPLTGAQQIIELAARNSLPDSPYTPWARQQFERMVGRYLRERVARLDPKASW